LGIGVESLRSWVKQAEVDSGVKPGTSSAEAEELKALRQEVKELRRANAILKSASAFFAAELDRPQR
jgi:transposase